MQISNNDSVVESLFPHPISKNISELPKIIFVCLHSISNLDKSTTKEKDFTGQICATFGSIFVSTTIIATGTNHFVLSFFILLRVDNSLLENYPEIFKISNKNSTPLDGKKSLRASFRFTTWWQIHGSLSSQEQQAHRTWTPRQSHRHAGSR